MQCTELRSTWKDHQDWKCVCRSRHAPILCTECQLSWIHRMLFWAQVWHKATHISCHLLTSSYCNRLKRQQKAVDDVSATAQTYPYSAHTSCYRAIYRWYEEVSRATLLARISWLSSKTIKLSCTTWSTHIPTSNSASSRTQADRA